MFSNLRKASAPEAGRYDAGGGNHHSSALRELGALLRERREAMGVSLAEVEVATRIRQKYLSALESDEWHLLPGEVVGRGFLRNYADYLGLEPDEAIDRRRAVSDLTMTSVLANTSSGSNLPPLREVDYRPKEVELKDEGDGIQRGDIRLTPVFAIVGVALLVLVAWWAISAFAGPIGAYFSDLPEQLASVPAPSEPETNSEQEPAPVAETAGVVNVENLGIAQNTAPQNSAPQDAPAGQSDMQGQGETAPSVPAEQATVPQTGTGGVAIETQNDPGVAQPSDLILVPTNTPELPPAVVEPAPAVVVPVEQAPAEDTPTEDTVAGDTGADLGVALPTATPDAAPAQPAQAPAAACGDARSLITSPGVNQTIAGVVEVLGTADHGEFQYFKLEYAPGLNAGGGFVYFVGSSEPVNGGLLGNLDTRALPNGEYTIRLTVVDQTSNYPPPCDVNIIIQN